MIEDNIPVIVGVGQFVERLDDPNYRGLSPVELAAAAARAALKDAGADVSLAERIAIVGCIRTFEDTVPRDTHDFGKAEKYPLAIAERLGLDPRIAILEKAGGNSPVTLLVDVAERLRAGAGDAALILGSEAISTVRHLTRLGEKRDWANPDDRAIEDHGLGLEGLISQNAVRHGVGGAPPGYGLLENARRGRLGLSREAYATEMGRLFAPFTRIAAENPFSSARVEPMSAEELVSVGPRNRMIADPYPLKLVSRDQVNQAAALLVMTRGAARGAGIAEPYVYVHATAQAHERDILYRPDLSRYRAAELVLESVLADAGLAIADVALFDFYSCFPVAVSSTAIDALGLDPDDPRGLTVTGGLPYFGGPGNNYSMHALAEMTRRLRAALGAHGLVGANGGILTKYAAILLSTTLAPWKPCRETELQAQLDAEPMPGVAHRPEGRGRVLTYTMLYKRGEPDLGVVAGVLDDGERFLANAADADTLAGLLDGEPIGREIFVTWTPKGNLFAWNRESLAAAVPRPAPGFRDAYYRYASVKHDGHVLEITINRPDAHNALDFEGNSELAEILDAFEADQDLWVAILTGAGDQAFCAGADLKAAGKGGGIPKAGFGGMTNRRTAKPVIAAVNGVAFGGGFETALACDLIVADPSARFGLTEVKVGMIAGAGGAIRLPRQIPRKVAMELMLTGRHMDAAEAHRWGLVNRISEPGGALEAARALAAEIIAGSPTSVRLTMQLVHEGEETPSADKAAVLMLSSTAIDSLMVSEDLAEGLAAFTEKRPPRWKNR